MGLSRNGVAPLNVFLGDQPVSRVYLGDILVWEKGMPVPVYLPAARAVATVVAPSLAAGQNLTVTPAVATGALPVPGLVVAVTVPAAVATATVPAPVASSSATVTVPPAVAAATVPPPTIAIFTEVRVPAAAAAAVVAAPMTGVGVTVPAAVAVAVAAAPTTAVRVQAAAATASAVVPAPVVLADRTIAAVPAVATATVPAPTIKIFPRDDFNRADAATLGSDWRVDINAQPRIATNRAEMKAMGFNDAEAGNWVSYQAGANSGRFAGDNYSVRAQLIAPTTTLATDNVMGVILAVADTFGSGVMCMFVGSTGNGCAIVTQSGSPPTSGIANGGQTGQTLRVTTGTGLAATDLIEFQRVGNVFTAYRNGTSFLTWTDTGAVVSSGATNRRWGFVVEGNNKFAGDYRSIAIDWIEARDL
ncbi:DUF7257 domain-containing protein [Nocardia sp. NPDC004711]